MDERLDAYLRFIQEDEIVDEAATKIAGMGVSTALFVVPMALRMASSAYNLHGLMSLIMDGEIKSLDSDEAKVSLEQRFGETAWSEIQEAGVVGNLAAMLVLNPIVWAQWRALFGIFSKAHRQCGVFKVSDERDACLKKARMQMSVKKMQILSKAKAACKKHKNPAKCVKTLDSGMAAEKKKIDKYKVQIQKLTMKGRVGAGSKPSKDTKLL